MPTRIEWTHRPGTTGETWQVVTGCQVLSAGCRNCYAMRLAGTRLKHHPTRRRLTRATKAGPVWNGQARFNRELLDQPLRWRNPRTVFVAAHGDLFYEGVADEVIDQVFAVMALASRHTFLVLTKRAARLRAYLRQESCGPQDRVDRIIEKWSDDWSFPIPRLKRHRIRNRVASWLELTKWPLSNCWLGVSVEDQATAEARIPDLLATPAALRWVSAEPLLDAVDVQPWLHDSSCDLPDVGICTCDHSEIGLDWVVAGGESDQNRPGRPVPDRAFRALRDQCAAAGVAYFQKQMPRLAPIPADLQVREWPEA